VKLRDAITDTGALRVIKEDGDEMVKRIESGELV
jgi:hypothetical protein